MKLPFYLCLLVWFLSGIYSFYLPVTIAGALMPDPHLWVGSAYRRSVSEKNAVIPYGAGVRGALKDEP